MKKLGQVFTPEHIVNRILSELDYKENNMLNKKIMEPSFGDGAFLKVIVRRVIDYCIEIKMTNEEIGEQLLNIYGIEIDTELYKETILELNKITDEYGLNRVKWNLFNEDTTQYTSDIKFDFIAGNPPYIKIHDLEAETRERLRSYKFSDGMLDMYIIFFEVCIGML